MTSEGVFKIAKLLFVDHEEDSAREVHVELFLNNIVTEFSVAQVKIYLGVTLKNHHLLISSSGF